MKNNNFNINYGEKLVSSIEVPREILDQIFFALFATQILVFIAANFVVVQFEVLVSSAWITLACLQVSTVIYMFARIFSSLAWGIITTYLILFFLAFSQSTIVLNIVLLLLLIGTLYAIFLLRVSRQKLLTIFYMAATAAIAILATKNAYTSFDMLPRLHSGHVHQDTLFHASISAMIKSYGVVSTGLHGLVETPYHILSHGLMASVSLLSRQSIIETYGVANWTLFSPILIMSIVFSSVVLDSKRTVPVELIWSFSSLILLIIPQFLEQWAFWDSYFVSESYLVSLGLLLVSLPFLYKQKINFFEIIQICLAAMLITSAKASVGIIFAGLWLARILFIRGGNFKFELVVSFVVSLIVFVITQSSVQSHANQIQLKIFGFLPYSYSGMDAVRLGYWLIGDLLLSWDQIIAGFKALFLFELYHFFFTWLIIGFSIYQLGFRYFFRSPLVVYALCSAFAGILVTGAFAIPGGSAYYFSNVAFFVAIPGVSFYFIRYFSFSIRHKKYFMFLLLSATSLGGAEQIRIYIDKANMASVHSPNEVVNSLLLIRLVEVKNTAYIYSFPDFSALPIQRCTAQPFLFPAVSERVWLDLIRPDGKCEFLNYSYEEYGFKSGIQEYFRPPVLLNGMKIIKY